MQDELETMLRRWAELEPERCDFMEGIGVSVSCEDMMMAIHYEDAREYIVQGAVQEAIEARGWDWKLLWDGFRLERNHIGEVQHRPSGTGLDSVPGEKFNSGWIDKGPAAALLSAYLQALESQNADA